MTIINFILSNKLEESKYNFSILYNHYPLKINEIYEIKEKMYNSNKLTLFYKKIKNKLFNNNIKIKIKKITEYKCKVVTDGENEVAIIKPILTDDNENKYYYEITTFNDLNKIEILMNNNNELITQFIEIEYI